MGKPSPHGALGIDVGPPAPAPPLELPPLELPPPEPPFDVELLVPLLVVVLGEAPMSLQYAGSCCRSDLSRFRPFAPKRTQPTVRSHCLAPSPILFATHGGRRFV